MLTLLGNLLGYWSSECLNLLVICRLLVNQASVVPYFTPCIYFLTLLHTLRGKWLLSESKKWPHGSKEKHNRKPISALKHMGESYEFPIPHNLCLGALLTRPQLLVCWECRNIPDSEITKSWTHWQQQIIKKPSIEITKRIVLIWEFLGCFPV